MATADDSLSLFVISACSRLGGLMASSPVSAAVSVSLSAATTRHHRLRTQNRELRKIGVWTWVLLAWAGRLADTWFPDRKINNGWADILRALLGAGIRVSGVVCEDAMGAKGLMYGGLRKKDLSTVNTYEGSRPLVWSGHDQEVIRLAMEVSHAVHQTGRISNALTRLAAEVTELMDQVDALAGRVRVLVAARDASGIRGSQPAPRSVCDDG